MYRCLYEDGTMILSGSPITPDGRKVVINGECERPAEKIIRENVKNVRFETKVKSKNCLCWFYEFNFLKEIQNLHLLDTSECTDMNYMFAYCSMLTSLDLNSFDTSNVKDMNFMFENCSLLTSLDLNSFDTTDSYLPKFLNNCQSLQNIHLPNTLKEINQSSFYGCINLKNIEWKNHIYTLEDLKEYNSIYI